MTAQKEKDDYIVAKRRVIFPIGGSKAITLPMDWVKYIERLDKKELNEVYTLMDEIVVVTPEERVEEFKEFLSVWSRLTPLEKETLITLGKQHIKKRREEQ